MATTRRRNPRSKQEVEQTFAQTQEKEANKTPISEFERQQTQARANQVRQAVQGFTVQDALNKVTQLSTDLNKTLGDLTEKISTKAQELQTLTEAVEITRQDLEELHGKESVLLTTSDLLAHHQAEVERTSKDLETLQAEYAEKSAALIKGHQQDVEDRRKDWEREEKEYVYARDQNRAKDTDNWKKILDDQKRAEDLRKADLERNWATREAELKAKETEYAQLKADAAALPEKIKKIEEAEFKKGYNTASKEATQEKQLLQKDFDAYKQLSESQLKNGQSTIEALTSQVAKLQTQLAEAQTQIKSIAEKALESASSERAFSQLASLQKNNEVSVQRAKS